MIAAAPARAGSVTPGGLFRLSCGDEQRDSIVPADMNACTYALDFGPGLDVAARTCASASALLAPENQDNFLLIDGHGRGTLMRDQHQQTLQLTRWPPGHMRVAIFDGMGGHGHGRQAAEAAANGVLHLPACATLDELAGRLDALHETLQSRFATAPGAGTGKRPGTTLTLLELRPGLAPLLYHVGDSRLYEISAGQVQPLTIDHVPATAFALQGLLGEAEWWQQVHGEHHPQISQAFILGNAISDPQVLADPLCALEPAMLPPFLRHMSDRRALSLRDDAVYLLATDGFWACARPAEWVTHWPALLGEPGLSSAAVLGRLFDSFIGAPPPGLHIDNLTAIALRLCPAAGDSDETALPGHAP